jgi:ferredoxin like protein
MSLPEKLSVNKFELDEGHPHIVVNNEVCDAVCKTKACLFVCPSGVYTEQDGKIIADWAGCVECGTCKAACPAEALTWDYPRGGFGIIYRYG